MRHFAVIGPSGAGKDTLIAAALARRPDLAAVRRVVTRAPDAGGEDIEAVTPENFARMRTQGLFLLDWDAHGLSYGLPRAAFAGGPKLVNLSRRVLPQATEALPGLRVIHVFARPEVLAARLTARGRETPAQIATRISRDTGELPAELDIIHIDNSTTLEAATTAFLAALETVST